MSRDGHLVSDRDSAFLTEYEISQRDEVTAEQAESITKHRFVRPSGIGWTTGAVNTANLRGPHLRVQAMAAGDCLTPPGPSL